MTGTFTVTIHTEVNVYDQIESNSIANVEHIPVLQDIFDRHGIRPTDLVTYEMVTGDEAIRVLKPIQDSGRCEIGHRLHVGTSLPLQQPTKSGVDAVWTRR